MPVFPPRSSKLLLLGYFCCALCGVSQAFSILRGPFPSLLHRPVAVPATDRPQNLHFIKEQLSGRSNESFLLFANDWGLDSNNAKRQLYHSFHKVSITYGWCLSPPDIAALKALREDLFGELGYIKDAFYRAKIEVALQLAFHAHHGQRRKSGEPFVHHPVAVAKILAGLRMDPDSIVAGLLHDTVEDTNVSLSDIQEVFGQPVRRLVEGETKVSRLPRSTRDCRSRSNEQTENLCHLIFAMSEDWRVLVVKLADRLHNMRTIDAMPAHKQERTAAETLDIFVPLAHKLGAWGIKTELENLSFRILSPTEHMALSYMTTNQVALLSSVETTGPGGIKMPAREALTDGVPRLLKSHKGVGSLIGDVQVKVVRKPSYQIWKQDPTLRSIEQQEDMLVARVVLSSRIPVEDQRPDSDRALCYRVLEVLQSAFPAMGHNTRDFIRFPKENMYMALHAPIRIKGFPLPIQVQVCMDWMDDVARLGMLAAVRDQEPGRSADVALELPWMRAMGEAAESVLEAEPTVTAPALMRSLKDHLTVRRLVFTPEGDVLDLEAHEGVCTARDAALAQLKAGGSEGDFQKLVGASVNGRHVPLSKALRHGDVVEVITRPYGGRWVSSPKALKSEAAVQTKPMRLWPWCLVGEEEGSERSALQAMWGSRVQPQRALRPGMILMGAGELEWGREAELRHGRMALAALAYWWLSPLFPLASFEGWEPSNTLAELIVWRGALEEGIALPPAQPWLLQAAIIVGLGEIMFSIFKTQKLEEESGLEMQCTRRLDGRPAPTSRPAGAASSRANASGSMAIGGVTVAQSIATIFAALRQQELSWGRLGMLCVLFLLAQTAVLTTFGTGAAL